LKFAPAGQGLLSFETYAYELPSKKIETTHLDPSDAVARALGSVNLNQPMGVEFAGVATAQQILLSHGDSWRGVQPPRQDPVDR
jgi:hypothetical protein